MVAVNTSFFSEMLQSIADRSRALISRRTPAHGRCLVVSAADPLNLAGLVTAGERVRAVAANRLVYRDGVPIAALEGEYVRSLAEVDPAVASDAARTLTGNPALSVVSGFVAR